MLATLVVHLKANYGNLTSGLNAARNQTAVAAQDIAASIRTAGGTANELAAGIQKTAEKVSELEESFTRNLMSQAIARNAALINRFADGTARARSEMVQLVGTSAQLRVPDAAPRRIQPEAGGGVNFIRVAAAAGQLSILSRVSNTLRGVRSTMATVGRTSEMTASSMTRFRMGLQAAKVDPSLNVAKNVIDRTGTAAANLVEKIRGMGDATISGIPATIGAIGTALGKLVGSGDSASATLSKFVSQIQTNSKGLAIFSAVFPGAAAHIEGLKSALQSGGPAAEQMAAKFDKLKAEVAALSNTARAAQYVLTGTFQKTGTSADLFSRSTFYALLPLRLLKRETEGANRVVRAAAHVFNFLTAPIHKVALALGHGKAEWQNLRALLPKLTGGLQLGVRAYRAFAQSAYVVGTTVRAVTNVVRGFTSIVSRSVNAVRSLTGPIRSATSSLARMTGVQNTFIGRALGMKRSADQVSGSLNRMSTSGSLASRGLSGMFSKVGLLKAGVAGLAAGAVMWGAKTAISAETSQVVFGTMLKDMDQGKALMDAMRATKVAPLFDPKNIQDAARDLFKAGVPVTQITTKMEQLGNIAVATKTPIEDLSRIYRQGMAKGAFQTGEVNQLAERGIDIYHALTAVTGKSGEALQDMMQKGQIGATTMNAAIEHMTTGQGIYAGAVANVSNTTEGMWAQMSNNVQASLGAMMGFGVEGMKPLLQAGVAFTEKMKTAFAAMSPIVVQVVQAVSALFTSLWGVISSVWTAIFGAGASTFGSLLELGMEWATKFRWFFTNFVDIAKFAFKRFTLFGMTAFNDFIYFFTDKLPPYLGWFGENWMDLFTDIATGTMTVISNLADNIGTAMVAIWDWIASGGTTELKFAFVPLLEGFEATVSKLPDVPARAMTQLETQLNAQVEGLGTSLADSFDSMMADATASMQVQAPKIELKDTASGADGGRGGDETPIQKAKAAENKAVLSRSTEGQQALANVLRGAIKDDDAKATFKETVKQTGVLDKIARNTEGPKLRPAQFAKG